MAKGKHDLEGRGNSHCEIPEQARPEEGGVNKEMKR
jgi:hypothetical protein